MARRHLAIFLKGAADKVLSGEKKVEIRLSQNRTLPYLEVSKDDEILLKTSGERVIGRALVENVLFYDNLTPKMVRALQDVHFEDTAMEDSFWQKKLDSHFATVIFLKNPQKFISPINFRKKDRRGWVVIDQN